MAPQRYERVSSNLLHMELCTLSIVIMIFCQVSNADNDDSSSIPRHSEDNPIPDSPPPSFRSRDSFPSSHRLLSSEDPAATEEERTLAEAFDDGTPSDDEDDGGDDRQRLMHSNPTRTPDRTSAADTTGQEVQQRPDMGRRMVTQLPPPTTGMPYRPFQSSNDGVFANLNAKPERGGEKEELPPVCLHFSHPFSLPIFIICEQGVLKSMSFPRPTNKPPQTQPLHTGTPPPSSPLEWPLTKSTTKVSLLAPSSPLPGTLSSLYPFSSLVSC